MEQKLRTGGYRVKLAIDTTIQETVEDTLENWTNYPRLQDPADKVYKSKNADGTYTEIVQPQAAAVVLDYRTGELKAIVGSRTRPTVRKTLNRATDMQMPVGSSIKPIGVYAPAIELGASPASIVYNMPLPISGWKDSDGKDSWPRNYGGGGYAGPETLRKALRQSHNTAAAQAEMTLVGVDRSVGLPAAHGRGPRPYRRDALWCNPGLQRHYAPGNGRVLWRPGQWRRVSGTHLRAGHFPTRRGTWSGTAMPTRPGAGCSPNPPRG